MLFRDADRFFFVPGSEAGQLAVDKIRLERVVAESYRVVGSKLHFDAHPYWRRASSNLFQCSSGGELVPASRQSIDIATEIELTPQLVRCLVEVTVQNRFTGLIGNVVTLLLGDSAWLEKDSWRVIPN